MDCASELEGVTEAKVSVLEEGWGGCGWEGWSEGQVENNV